MDVPDPLVPFAVIRAVGVPHAPFDGLLARDSDGDTVLLVDRDELRGWAGWNAVAAEHVLSPRDVVRRHDGHDVVFPVVDERLDRFVARRAASSPLTEGETVTIAVSVLRGLASVLNAPPDSAQWWLTDAGRPVLVLGVGDSDARRASADVLGDVAETATASLRDTLSALVEIVATARRPAVLVDAEDELFRSADPEALATEVLAPARVAPVRRAEHDPEIEPDAARPWWVAFAARFDADLSDLLERARRRRRRGDRSRAKGGRRLPLLVGAAVAALVVAGGMLWPQDEDAGAEPVATASSPVTTPEPSASSPAQPTAGADPATAEVRDPVSELGGLLDTRRACGDDACRASVMEDPTRAWKAGVIDLAPEQRSITEIDDLGGLVVLRVDALDGAATSQLVTIVDTPNGWRLRDVFDVTEPP
jgi:hypothetical protein